jgi:hypothetical protein
VLISLLHLLQKHCSPSTYQVLLGIGTAVIVFLFVTKQRGAHACILWFILCLAILLAKHKNIPRSVKVLSFLFPLGLITLIAVQYSTVFSRYLSEGLQSSRLIMWKAAFNAMDGFWLFGHGYGSWFQDFTIKAREAQIEAYDTAHNFFVQTVFELGLLHLLAILSIAGLLAGKVLIESWKKGDGQVIVVTHALGLWLLAITVQEIDFVRSVFYFNAMAAGWLLAQSLDTGEEIEQRAKPNRAARVLGYSVSICLMFFSVFFLSKISIGGYQFEANALNQYQHKVRWLRPTGTLGSFHPSLASDIDTYDLHPILASVSESILIKRLDGAWMKVPLLHSSSFETFLPVPHQRWYQPPFFYKANDHILDESRFLSLMIAWPPIPTTLPFLAASGFFPWERSPIDGTHIRWCGSKCSAQFLPCSQTGEKRILSLMAARPDISLENPLTVIVENSKDNLSLTFHESNQSLEVAITDFTIYTMHVNRTYATPGDAREKGVLFTRSQCRREDNPATQ